jgi:hypothetical protein
MEWSGKKVVAGDIFRVVDTGSMALKVFVVNDLVMVLDWENAPEYPFDSPNQLACHSLAVTTPKFQERWLFYKNEIVPVFLQEEQEKEGA